MPDKAPQKKIESTHTPELVTESEALELFDISQFPQTSSHSKTQDETWRLAEGGSASADILTAGTEVAEVYKIVSCINNGRKSTVYKVERKLLSQHFVLKLFAGDSSTSFNCRAQEEARIAGRFDHPNIARTVDAGVYNGRHLFYVMEFIEGETLAEYLNRCGRLTYDDIFSVFIPLCRALQNAKEKGIAHGGVNPGNIMLTGQQGSLQCKLFDFGNAKLLDGERPAEFEAADLEEDPIYMSPELLNGQKVDHLSDIYSLGCTLFEAITARPPFSADTRDSIRNLHLNAAPPTLREASLGRDFPEELERIVQTMLAKDPQQRFNSASQVADNLMRLTSANG
ncbi:MAG: serine/threonine protein kinase [Candidatus Melainabacteria bacterium]|nr:serine/threonine protein kinase [Candidatus Melainabacteria bacterium]